MPLTDGTNDEGEDLATPLPLEWTTKDSLTDVKLYGLHNSPPCAKLRALLHLAGVKYERCAGMVPGASYRKIPVIFVNGRQINDSFIIVKNLAPILFGKNAMSDEDVELERMITYGLMISLERECFGNCEDIKKMLAVGGIMTGFTGAILRYAVPFSWLGPQAARNLDNKHPDLLRPVDYCHRLKTTLDSRGTPYFGGKVPGAVDASAYGVLCVFVSDGSTNAMEFACKALADAGLEEWYHRIRKEIPDVLKREGTWPFYT